MATGSKRPATMQLQSRSKKAKTPTTTTGSSLIASSSPTRHDEGDTQSSIGDSKDVLNEAMACLDTIRQNQGKEDGSAKEFIKTIELKHAEVQKTLTDLKEKIMSDKIAFESKMLPLFRQALAPIDPNDIQAGAQIDSKSAHRNHADDAPELQLHVPTTAAGFQTFILESNQLITSSHKLIKTYKALRNQEIDQPPLYSETRLDKLADDFKKDRHLLITILNAGRSVALKDVEDMLSDRNREVRGRGKLRREDEIRGRKMLDDGIEGGSEEDENQAKEGRKRLGWGVVAGDAVKVLGKLERVGLTRSP